MNISTWIQKYLSEKLGQNRHLYYFFIAILISLGVAILNIPDIPSQDNPHVINSSPQIVTDEDDVSVQDSIQTKQDTNNISSPTAILTPKPSIKSNPSEVHIVQPISIPAPKINTEVWQCSCRKTCSQMSSCAEAQYQLNVCGCGARDGDNDGTACDADCQ